jgi:hypothetical protein
MLTILLIERRAQSPADDRLAATQTVPSCAGDFESTRLRKQAPLEVADAARDPPQGTARSHVGSHIAGTTKATPQ